MRKLTKHDKARNVRAYWEIHPRLLSVIANSSRPRRSLTIDKSAVSTVSPVSEQSSSVQSPDTTATSNSVLSTAHRRKQAIPANYYKPEKLAPEVLATRLDPERRQPEETVDAFLLRCPPSTSSFYEYGPWLWIYNRLREPRNQRSFTIEHEIDFKDKGFQLLSEYTAFETSTRQKMDGKAPGTITRVLTPKRKALKQAIWKLALDTNCFSGKWMIFPRHEDADRVWRAVCQGVDSGKLGHIAKIATSDPPPDPMQQPTTGFRAFDKQEDFRLICVYTKDFSDEKDVRRVLDSLVELKLVKLPEDDMSNGIYYKCDAYTHLDISSKSPYGLKASLYSSRAMLKGVKWGD